MDNKKKTINSCYLKLFLEKFLENSWKIVENSGKFLEILRIFLEISEHPKFFYYTKTFLHKQKRTKTLLDKKIKKTINVCFLKLFLGKFLENSWKIFKKHLENSWNFGKFLENLQKFLKNSLKILKILENSWKILGKFLGWNCFQKFEQFSEFSKNFPKISCQKAFKF